MYSLIFISYIIKALTIKIYIGVFGVMLQNSPKKSKSPRVRLGE